VYRECAYARADGDFALCWHVDAEAAGVVREAGIAGDNAIAINSAEAQWIRPVRATVLERDRSPVGGSEQDDTCSEHPAAQWFATDLRAGRHRVPTVAWMDLDPIAAA
jgi:hypothetical protein